jgi:hypothetical protein
MIWRKYRLGLEAELERAMIISREKICHRRQDWNTGALTGSPDMPIHRSRRFTMKDNVTLIPVRKKAGSRVKTKEDKPKLRVAAYCRVSTDSDEQAGSYEIQVAHYTDYISRNPEWELAGIYAER